MSLETVIDELDQLAIIFGTENTAKNLINDLASRETAIRDSLDTFPMDDEDEKSYDRRIGTVRVFVQISKEPLFTVGKGSFLNDLIETAGGKSVTANVRIRISKIE